MEENQQVEELEHFPFGSFKEFREESKNGAFNIKIDHGIAAQWAQKGMHATPATQRKVRFYVFLPLLALIGFLIYVVMTSQWLQLLWLPIIAILFFLYHPTTGMLFGWISPIAILLTTGTFIYSLFSGPAWLLVLSVVLVLIWWGEQSVYRVATRALFRAMLEHEDLLSQMWQKGHISIWFSNGDSYWSDFKEEGGKITHYDEEKRRTKELLDKIYIGVVDGDEKLEVASRTLNQSEDESKVIGHVPVLRRLFLVNESDRRIHHIEMYAGGYEGSEAELAELPRMRKSYGTIETNNAKLLDVIESGQLDYHLWHHLDIYWDKDTSLKVAFTIHKATALKEENKRFSEILNEDAYFFPLEYRAEDLESPEPYIR